MISLPPRLATVLIVPLLLAWARGPTGPVAQQTATPAPTAKSDGSDTQIPLGEKEIEAMIRTAIAGAGTREASRNSEDTHMPTPPPKAEEPFPPTDTPLPTIGNSQPPSDADAEPLRSHHHRRRPVLQREPARPCSAANVRSLRCLQLHPHSMFRRHRPHHRGALRDEHNERPRCNGTSLYQTKR